MAEETYFDAVCVSCSESRYRSKGPVSPTTKASPEFFESLGDAPPPESYPDGLRCYACDSPLKFMPVSIEKIKPPTSDRATLRQEMVEAQAREARLRSKQALEAPKRPLPAPISPGKPSQYQVTLFEADSGEDIISISEISEFLFLVKTTKRILIIDANQILEAK